MLISTGEVKDSIASIDKQILNKINEDQIAVILSNDQWHNLLVILHDAVENHPIFKQYNSSPARTLFHE
jgi:hypothetical protein